MANKTYDRMTIYVDRKRVDEAIKKFNKELDVGFSTSQLFRLMVEEFLNERNWEAVKQEKEE